MQGPGINVLQDRPWLDPAGRRNLTWELNPWRKATGAFDQSRERAGLRDAPPEGETVMLRISKKSQLNSGEILAKASRFFGKGGEGLDETERGPCCISFSGAGGFVTVTVCETANERDVDVETREFEYQAKRFLGSL
jgi:hypothetical protein